MDISSEKFSIGIDVGGTKTSVVLVDDKGAIKLIKTLPTVIGNPQAQIELMKTLVCNICAESGILVSQINSFGVGIPGTVEAQRVVFAPNIEWKDVQLKDAFKSVVDVPIFVIQDTHAAAAGEFLAGAGQGYSNIVCVSIGTGIGAGLILNGKLYTGSFNAAGELGHFICEPDGRLCKCGKRGCLETCVSGSAMNEMAHKIGLSFGGELFIKAENGDIRAKEFAFQVIKNLGSALVNIANLLSPDLIVISGGLCEQEYLIKELSKYVTNNAYSVTSENIKIVKAILGEKAPVIGAALIYRILS